MNTQPTIELQTLTDVLPAPSFKEIAMSLVARGIPVIPIPPLQKGAVLKHWPNLATIELEQIEKWNEENPHYNAGAVAKLDGFLMLDCDVPSLQQKIEKSTGQVFPETFSVRSSKGLHFYFKHTNVSRELKKNIQLKDSQSNVLGDVKVHNGYVVAPGSIHPSGRLYELVNDAEIVDAPDWLVAWIKKQQRQSEKVNKQFHVGEHKVKEGGRDNFLFDEACKLRNSGQSKEHALINLIGINQDRCDPPMDASIVQQKIDSAFSREPKASSAVAEVPIQKADPTPVDGPALLCSLEEHFRRYAVIENGLPLVLSLWSIATHLFSGFDTFPYLAVTSPTRRCGKSRLGELLQGLCANPERTVQMTPAVLFRLVQETKPTLIIDEAESLRGKDECSQALRAILNVGYRRGNTVRRNAKQNVDGSFTLQAFETFCPKVIILIGNLRDTLADRCIPVRMKRRTNESLARFRFGTVSKEAAPLKSKIAIWAAANAKEVTDFYEHNDLPYLSDRDAELWLPLFAALNVADRTRVADLEATAQRLSGAKSENEPTELGIRLLTDIRQIFNGCFDTPEHLPSEALLNRLIVLDESPWADLGFGKILNARKLADLLRPYEIRPKDVRTGVGTQVKKAYKKDSFKDAWDRYLDPAAPALVVAPSTVINAPKLEGVNASDSADEGDLVTIDIDQNGDATAVHGT